MQGNISFKVKDFKKIWFKNILFLVENGGYHSFAALKLKDDDLRIIDEKIVRDFMFDNLEKFRLLDNPVPSDKVFYRH